MKSAQAKFWPGVLNMEGKPLAPGVIIDDGRACKFDGGVDGG